MCVFLHGYNDSPCHNEKYDSYTKTIYTFSDGALTNTVTSMIAQSNGMYTMSYLSKWQDDYAAIAAATSVVSQLGTAGNYIYAIGSRNLRELGSLTGTTTLGNSIVVNGKTYNVKTDAAGPYYEELAYEKQPRQQVPQNEIANFEYYQYDQTTNKIISQVFKMLQQAVSTLLTMMKIVLIYRG